MKILLILDLDETLIHATEEKLEHDCDFEFDMFYVYTRPYLQEFVEAAITDYRLAIWSSGTSSYVEKLVDGIGLCRDSLEFVWSRNRCTRRFDPELQEFFFLKDLKKVKKQGYDLNRVLIMEDEPRKVHKSYGNAIYVKPFYGTADSELLDLKDYLQGIKNVANVRELEKRNWRSETVDRR